MKTFFYTPLFIFFLMILVPLGVQGQPATDPNNFTRQDTLRGSIGPGRSWWDITRYDISIDVNIPQKFIRGFVDISYKILETPGPLMQIDLQEPMRIGKVQLLPSKKSIGFKREGNVFWLDTRQVRLNQKSVQKIRIFFEGHPKVAKHAPWDGGWVWTSDSLGRPWATAACQGLGSSVWYPCKDHQSDEPDEGASISITIPDTLVAVSNGRLSSKINTRNKTTTWSWAVVNPINNYLIIPYIGKYVNFTEEFQGEKGKLDLSYWVLDYNLKRAKKQFAIVKPMIQCFESWMGPYPFYEDSYKLVDAPHLGMEHQSAVAYGNKYLNGYLGYDRSGSGWGSDWDFIIVHESGHEWFANNITSADIGDMWLHESFTTYSETLFVQCLHGLKAANEYVQGQRRNILNLKPMIGKYGVNNEGSDLYDKGANLIHIIRQLVGNDTIFKAILRGLNKDFYHQVVTTKQIENYIAQKTGKKLDKVFDQYLRTVNIPALQYKIQDDSVLYRWANCVSGFDMPVKLNNGTWLYPTENFQAIGKELAGASSFSVNPNFYIVTEKLP